MANALFPPNFLAQWRKHRGYSQQKLSDLAGFGNKSYVSLFEKRERRLNGVALQAYAHALGCQDWEIMGVNPLAINAPKDKPPSAPNVIQFVEQVQRIPDPEDRDVFIDTTVSALERLRSKKTKKPAPTKRKQSTHK